MCDCSLAPTQQIVSYIMVRTSQCGPLLTRTTPFTWISYSASTLKQQSADRPVAPLGHTVLILSQPVFALSP
jgi:hypothetical protein